MKGGKRIKDRFGLGSLIDSLFFFFCHLCFEMLTFPRLMNEEKIRIKKQMIKSTDHKSKQL